MTILSVTDIVVLAVGTIILLLWLFLYFKGKQYEELFASLDTKDYPLGDTYFVGYAATLLLKFDYRNQSKPWGNSRNALERTINRLRGLCIAPDHPKKE